jgi:hypothetical protein
MFTCPFQIRRPQPHAEDAAEESVTTELSDRVACRPVVAYGSLIKEHQYEGLPWAARERPSTIVATETAIPSTTQKITFFACFFCEPDACVPPQAEAAIPAAIVPMNVRRVNFITPPDYRAFIVR